MSDKLRDMIDDMEPRCLQAKAGARFLVNLLCEQLPANDRCAAGALFVAERLEEIVDEMAERREALHAELARARTPPERPRGPVEVVKE